MAEIRYRLTTKNAYGHYLHNLDADECTYGMLNEYTYNLLQQHGILIQATKEYSDYIINATDADDKVTTYSDGLLANFFMNCKDKIAEWGRATGGDVEFTLQFDDIF